MVTRDLSHRVFQLALRVVRLCFVFERQPGVTWVLAQQLLYSGTAMARLVEEAALHRDAGRADQLWHQARRRVLQTNYWLRVLHHSGLCDAPELIRLLDETRRLLIDLHRQR